jgi:hypothetical protein
VQELHLVGFTTDRRGLILSVHRGAPSGSYTIAIDSSLITAIDDARAEVGDAAADEPVETPPIDGERPQSQLSVREVQSRLRQGRSVDEVARDAGVAPSWVARFAAPVLTEQAEIMRVVRGARLSKRTGVSGAPLGEAVYRNLAERGFTPPRDELDQCWSARQLVDGLWEVAFAYSFGGRDHHVRWSYDVQADKVKPRDRIASQLGYRPATPPPKRRASNQTRLVAARKAAAAAMVAQAEDSSRRNAVVAGNAPKTTAAPELFPI